MNRSVLSLAALAVVGCNPHHVVHNPAPPVSVPRRFRGESAEAPPPDKWWRDFGDPKLSGLIERGLAGNLQLRAAWARLAQARAVAKQAASGYWPQIEAALTANRQKFRSPFADVKSGGGGGGFPSTFTLNAFSWSVSAAYEVDLWKRVSSQAHAAALDFQASRADAETQAMTMAAEIAEAYYDLVYQRQRRSILEEQVETNKSFLELIRLRFEQGLATSLDIYQQQQQLIATRAQLPLVDASIEVSQNRLALLLGQPPVTAVGGELAELPELPPIPGSGIPADLLERRPDVRSARMRVEAADYRVAVAVADRLPSLRLTGELSARGDQISELIASPLWSLLASVTAPLFDGWRRAAEVDRTKAVVKERLAAYGQTLLGAMVEVENALAQERQQLLYIEQLEAQLDTAEKTLREARVRYREGLSDFLNVLTSLQSLQGVQLNLLGARRQLISYRIQLCRALGGTWTRALEPRPGAPPKGEGK